MKVCSEAWCYLRYVLINNDFFPDERAKNKSMEKIWDPAGI